MKVFHLFLGLFFLISIAVSPSIVAGSPIPAGLQSAIDRVKAMKRSGASRKDIAAYVTRTVKNRVTFLNHSSKKLDSILGDAKVAEQLKRFDAFWDKGNLASDEFSAAVWVWVNRIGQCNEGASTAFHILVMAYESTDEITTVTKGDHRFVILGNVKNLPDPFFADDLRKLDNTYIVDPWDGKSFSTKDLSFFDWFQHGEGNPVARTKYRFYKRKYNNWLIWCKKNPVEFQKWLYGLSEAAAEDKLEHKDSMKFTLTQHQKKIEALKALKEQILQKGTASLKKIKSNIKKAGFIQFELKKYETLILSLVDQGKNFCDEARVLHQKIISLSAAMEDGESLVNDKINLAKDRRANCQTDADGAFIKNNYQAAQDAFAIMRTAKKKAFKTLVDINIKFKQIKTINNELSQHDSDSWKETRRQHEEILEAIPQYLDQLETGIEDAKGFPGKVQALKAKIEDSKQYYIQYFPGAEADFDQLISEVSSIRLDYVIDPAGQADLYQEYQTAQTALDTPTGNNPRLFRGTPPFINCFSDTASKKVMDKIDEAFLRGLLVLKTSDYLRNGCKVKVAIQEPAKDSDSSPSKPPSVDAGGSTPGTPAVAPDNRNAQSTSSNTMGGLIIMGPVKLVAGQGVTYTACDGTGVPYTSGSFSWGFSDESVMSLEKSGNPVSGVGFKAGKVTIFVHYDGGDVYSGTAWLDVKIKAKENNLFSTTGGEDSQTGQSDLFGTTGGETIADETTHPGTDIDCSHIPGSTAVQGDCICTGGLILSPSQGRCISCGEYYQSAKNAITDGALNAAQSIVKEAGECTSWTVQVQGLINSARHDQICKTIAANIQAACQSNNAKAAHGFMIEAYQNKCHIDDGLWQWGNKLIAEYDQRIKDQRAAQQQQQAQAQRPQHPQNQTNWMDVMNTLIKGVQGVQQGGGRSSGGASKPLPSADSVWQSHHPSVNTRTNYDKQEYNRILDMCRKGLKGLSMAYAKNRYKSLTCEEIANYYGYGICPTWAIKCKNKDK